MVLRGAEQVAAILEDDRECVETRAWPNKTDL